MWGCDLNIEVVSAPLSRAYEFPWEYRLNWEMKDWASFWSLADRINALKYLVKFIYLFKNC